MNANTPSALIAEDEPLLARGLARTLGKLWPALRIEGIMHDGDAAIEAAHRHLPDILFLDIQMPARNGLDAAEDIIDNWPAERPLPLIVFVTAFDEFACQAFEQAALDYVLKPVSEERLQRTVERLQRALENWQPRFLDWWKDMGPDGTSAFDVYLRTAISVDAKGWADYGRVKMPDYRWGIFLAPAVADRKIAFFLRAPYDPQRARVRLVAIPRKEP